MNRSRGLAAVGLLAAVAGLAAALIALTRSDGGDEVGRCTAPDEASVVRVWNEQVLDAIRRDTPAPTVHARNLFHLSAVMWDAWVAYGGDGQAVYVDLDRSASDANAARIDAINLAAHRLLTERYRDAEGRIETLSALDATLAEQCGQLDVASLDDSSAAAVGLRIADEVLDQTFDDGADERLRYLDPDYRPVNPPLDPTTSGTELVDPNRWQPLALETSIAQNGLPLPSGPQVFIGSQWGEVEGFALSDGEIPGLPVDPGPPPLLGTDTDLEYRKSLTEVIEAGAALETGVATIDLSPGARGNNEIGRDDGAGHELNPTTGGAYEPNVVDLGDYGRVIAEYWADGPDSETPPGHWNTIAHGVSDALSSERLLVGREGDPVDRLEWDVKLHLALNGAMHDAAIAAWGAKAHYDYVRPISMIRHAGGLGQSSDPDGPSYHPEGLLVVDGLVEVVTAESSAPGERHEALADHVGEVAVRSWLGAPDDPEVETTGVGWLLAVDWVPYQRPTFVTPAFAAYVSGHSTFSRAGAEVLAEFTGSPFFPGGLSTWTVAEGALLHEDGPTADVTLQWATYGDAADEAGRSRIFGGIHVAADDVAGRLMGAEVGRAAVAAAFELFG
ncbi:MAG: vanadium-dependent haloperoxidase [Actinomycetota bacterium]